MYIAFEIKNPQIDDVPLLLTVSLRKLKYVTVNKTKIKCNHPMAIK